MAFQLLMICSLLGLGSAWNQPSTCYVRQSSCSGDSEVKEDTRRIRETLESSLTSISASLEQLVKQKCEAVNTNPPTEPAATTDSPTEPAATTDPPTEPAVTTDPPTEPAATTDPPTEPAVTTDPPTEPAANTEIPPPIGTFDDPASSCSDISSQGRPSGEYWIATDRTSSPAQVYCDMNRTSCSCNTTGGWMRVANLDMTNPYQNCPAGFGQVNRDQPPLRTCGRGERGCTSTTYSTYGVEYSKVCGRIIAYQSGTPDAFHPYFRDRARSIDDGYVDGVSLTHGQSPRQHIWTFANAVDETRSTYYVCPCTRPDLPYTGIVPPFIGQDYFCETGSREAVSFIFYRDDPVWDGQGCGSNSTCCEFNNPPWFCKQLPLPTTDDIELRLCFDHNFSNENTPIELVEIYVR
ncbi:uncharacterized protein LOC135336382 [Halichondria panicea]|uniref:uncharacterized protein LOC135336382 n=1 Tax=Halichondria panicea TaxID=6063 RepID=UPI00312BCB9A